MSDDQGGDLTLEEERDLWREEAASWQRRTVALVERLDRELAERDRLRAVVTAVHMLIAALDRGVVADEMAIVREKIAALDTGEGT